jgi:glycerol-3-phosphate dehydrogenase (NAD(P)+)
VSVAVLGAGAWGSALAIAAATRHPVRLWARDPRQAQAMAATRVNARYLPGRELPAAITVTDDLDEAVRDCAFAIAATPTGALASLLRQVRDGASTVPAVVWACKGFDAHTGELPHRIVARVLGEDARCGVLSGPSFADEIARGLPAALTLASREAAFAHEAAQALHGPRLRVYSSRDVIGVEVGGAAKNVMAIAAGICDGLALGLNARAALITRGLAELTRLGLALGGRAETLMGLAGAGDLILTCTGDLSRNRRIGLLLAAGTPLSEALAALGHVAEGVNSARALHALATANAVDMPITAAVCEVLDGRASPGEVVQALMRRDPRPEGA